MKGENGVPETPEWSLPRASCADHGGVCENAQHCIWLRGEAADEHLILGEN